MAGIYVEEVKNGNYSEVGENSIQDLRTGPPGVHLEAPVEGYPQKVTPEGVQCTPCSCKTPT